MELIHLELFSLDKVLADKDADRICQAHNDERHQRQPEDFGNTKHGDPEPEDAHGDQQFFARVSRDRSLGHVQRAHKSAEGEGGAQDAKPVSADVQDGRGIDGQERNGAAKQNRKQVEPDRPEDNLTRGNEFEPGKNITDADRGLADDLNWGADHGGEDGGDHECNSGQDRRNKYFH